MTVMLTTLMMIMPMTILAVEAVMMVLVVVMTMPM